MCLLSSPSSATAICHALAALLLVVSVVSATGATHVIAASYMKTCVLSAIGEVKCVGRTESYVTLSPPAFETTRLVGLLQGSSRWIVNCGLDSASRLHCWGEGGTGIRTFTAGLGPVALAVVSTLSESVCVTEQAAPDVVRCSSGLTAPAQLPFPDVTHIASTGSVVCVATASDQAFAISCTNLGAPYPSAPGIVSSDATIVELCAGVNHFCYLMSDGQVACFGPTSSLSVLQTPAFTFQSISCGPTYTCGIASVTGAVQCWGDAAPLAPSGVWTTISAGYAHVCGLTFLRQTDALPSPHCFGISYEGELTLPNAHIKKLTGEACSLDIRGQLTCLPFAMRIPDDYTLNSQRAPFADATMSLGCTFAVSDFDGYLSVWGDECTYNTWTGAAQLERVLAMHPESRVKALCSGWNFVCAAMENGTAACAGLPEFAWLSAFNGTVVDQLMCGTYEMVCYTESTNRTLLKCIGAPWYTADWNQPAVFEQPTCGDEFCCFLIDGYVHCAGSYGGGNFREWGIPLADSSSPVRYRSIAAAAYTLCGVTYTGVVQCFGADSHLANPPPPCGEGQVQAIACGWSECCYLAGDASTCWGATTNIGSTAQSFAVPSRSTLPAPVGRYALSFNDTVICPPGTIGAKRGYATSLCGGVCLPGHYQNVSGSTTCGPSCPVGTYCPARALAPLPCPAGRFGVVSGEGSPACSGACPPGYYCPEGTTSSTAFPCPGGTYGAIPGLPSPLCSGRCSEGYVCPPASTSPNQLACNSPEAFCPIGSASATVVSSGYYRVNASAEASCVAGEYCQSGRRRLCGTGTFSPVDASDTCTSCAPGRYQSLTGASTCHDCPVSAYSPIPGQSQCILCENGPSINNRTACTRITCPRGFEYVPLAGACLPCLPGTYGIGGGETDSGRCVACPAGTYSLLNSTIECVPCASDGSMTCVSGQVFVAKGYWVSTSSDSPGYLQLSYCPERLCLGWSSADGVSCAEHRVSDATNLMCRDCEPGYSEWAGTCIPCGSETNVGFALLWIVFSWIYVIVLHRLSQKTVGVTGIYLFYVQMIRVVMHTVVASAPAVRGEDGTLSTSQSGSASSGLTNWLKFMEFDAQDINVDYCPMQTGSTQRFLISVASTAFAFAQLFATMAVHYVYVRYCTHQDGACKSLLNHHDKTTNPQLVKKGKTRLTKLKDSYFRSAMALLMFTYSKQAGACLSYFFCVEVDGEHVLRSDPSVSCSSADYNKGLILVLIVFIFHVVLFPLVCAVLLWRNRGVLGQDEPVLTTTAPKILPSSPSTPTLQLERPMSSADDVSEPTSPASVYRVNSNSTHVERDWKLRLGAFCEPYHGSSFWWQLTVMARRLYISIVFALVVDYSLTLMMIGLMILVVMMAHAYRNPFVLARDNRFEAVSLFAIAVVTLLGLKSVDANTRYASAAATASAASSASDASSSAASAFTIAMISMAAIATCAFTLVFLYLVLRKTAVANFLATCSVSALQQSATTSPTTAPHFFASSPTVATFSTTAALELTRVQSAPSPSERSDITVVEFDSQAPPTPRLAV